MNILPVRKLSKQCTCNQLRKFRHSNKVNSVLKNAEAESVGSRVDYCKKQRQHTVRILSLDLGRLTAPNVY